MAQPRIVLHIGRQKTGTTSIQRFLAANPEALAAEGILYPESGRRGGGHSAHHELAIALNRQESEGDELDDLRRAFREELAGSRAELIVFSSEAFQRLRDLDRLSHFLGATRPQVVCYLRECLAAKQSSWAQAIHATGQCARFVDFATGTRLGYRSFVKRWQRWSGELDLALFERGRLEGGDVIVDFLHRIGHDALADRVGELPRDDGLPSLGGNLLHVRHVMNVMRAGTPDRHGTFEALSALAASEPRWRGRWRVAPEERAAIERVDADDRRFLRSLFGEPARVELDELPLSPDPATLAEDTRRILSDPLIGEGFASLGFGELPGDPSPG